LIFTESFWPYIGGVAVMAAELLPELRRCGHELRLIAPHDYLRLPDEDVFAGMQIVRVPLLAALKARDIGALAKIADTVTRVKRDFRPDLVHVNSVGLNAWLHLQTAPVAAGPVLVSIHQLRFAMVTERDSLQGRCLRAADLVTCCSGHLCGLIRERLPKLGARCRVVHNELRDSGEEPVREASEEPTVLCVGRLDPAKGFDLAIHALAKLHGRHPEIRLLLAGDGPERDALERLAGRLGIRDRIDFLGGISPSRVPALLAGASLFLMPSRREGLPLAAIEASLAAVPIVAAEVGGIPELIEAGRTGLLVPPEDSSALADAMALVLADPARATALGRAARCRARTGFDLQGQVAAYDALYRELGTPART